MVLNIAVVYNASLVSFHNEIVKISQLQTCRTNKDIELVRKCYATRLLIYKLAHQTRSQITVIKSQYNNLIVQKDAVSRV